MARITVFVIAAVMLGYGSLSYSQSDEPSVSVVDNSRLVKILGDDVNVDAISSYGKFYSESAIFVDPEVSLSGRSEIVAYFSGLLNYFQVGDTVVKEVFSKGSSVVVFWDSSIQLLREGERVAGSVKYELVSELKFDGDGKISYRRDYFDQFTLYHHIPGFKENAQKWLADYVAAAAPATLSTGSVKK